MFNHCSSKIFVEYVSFLQILQCISTKINNINKQNILLNDFILIKIKIPGYQLLITSQNFQQICVNFDQQKSYEKIKIKAAIEENKNTEVDERNENGIFTGGSKEAKCEQGLWTTEYKKPVSKGKFVISIDT